ncbi:MAG: tetratricopeptide repeat protein [Siculibacillus sp.]|nr:tetratricopeptide repeat protein [Siculibacillus sp.]
MSDPGITVRLAAAHRLHRAGAFAEALEGYAGVLALDPDHPDALNLAASATRSLGDAAAAVDLARRAVAAAPDRADVRYNHGNALSAIGDPRGAAEAFRIASALDPTHADAAANLGLALARAGDDAGAEAAYRAALAVDADHRMARLNLGNLLGECGRGDEGIAELREVVRRHPDLAEGHYDLGLALLRAGDWITGFAEYEWRWRTDGFASPPRHTDIPDWDGRPLDGRSLLVHAEQGLGDTLQFVRLLPLAASLGARITLEAPTVLVRLLADVAGAETVTDAVDAAAFDLQTPLMGLPHRLGLTPGALPPRAASLTADPARVALWRERLRLVDGAEAVAVAWRGNPNSPADRGRSFDGPARLAPLAAPGRRLIAVQKLPRDELEPAPVASGWRVANAGDQVIEHPGPDFDAGRDAFLDTAAVLAICGRVVTIDTSLAHLAASLGRPTEILLKRVADWRWLERRPDTPWYPTVRLHRQTVAGDWSGPLASVVAALARG